MVHIPELLGCRRKYNGASRKADRASNCRKLWETKKTVEPTNPEVLTILKVGDRAQVKEGILTKEGGAGSSAPSLGPKY